MRVFGFAHGQWQEERKEYSLKDFESDAAAVLKDASHFSWEDVEKFMAENL